MPHRPVGVSVSIACLLGLGLALGVSTTSARSGAAAGSADQEKHGGNIVFEVRKNRQKLPHVIFSHEVHLDAGHECKDCHNDNVFKSTKKLGVNSFTMKDVLRGRACGACHNGKTVVRGKVVYHPRKNCRRCHQMKWRERPDRR